MQYFIIGMRKSVTPIIAIVLLTLMTVGAVGVAFFWVSNIQSSLQESVGSSVGAAPGSDCSRLQVISMRGDGVVVSNTGCDTVENVSVVIDGVLYEYDLDQSLAPGEAGFISFTESLIINEEHCVTITLPSGQRVIECVTSRESTEEAGFAGECETVNDCSNDSNPCTIVDCISGVCEQVALSDGEYMGCNNSYGCAGSYCECVDGECINNLPYWFADCGIDGTVVEWEDKTDFSLDDDLTCGCFNHTIIEPNPFTNRGFETGDTTNWSFSKAGEFYEVNSNNPQHGSYSLYFESSSTNQFAFYHGSNSGHIVSNDSLIFGNYINSSSSSFRVIINAYFFNGTSPVGDDLEVISQYNFYHNYTEVDASVCDSIPQERWFTRCLKFKGFDEWHDYLFDFAYDFDYFYPEIGWDKIKSMVVAIEVFGDAEGYFDNITSISSTTGLYADSDNDLGEADGYCYSGNFVPSLFKSFDITNELSLPTETILFNTTYETINPLTCTLNISNNNYDMTETSYYASTTQGPFSTYDTYSANITCSNSKGSNYINSYFTIGHFKNKYELLVDNLVAGISVIPQISDITDDDNKETLFSVRTSEPHNDKLLLVNSTGGIILSIDSIDQSGYYCSAKAADINNSFSGSELLYPQEHEGLFIYNNTGYEIWNKTISSNIRSNLAISDINNDGLLETLISLGSLADLYSFYPNGSLYKTHYWGVGTPTVAEIISSNTGPEIITGWRRSSMDYYGLKVLNKDFNVEWDYNTGYESFHTFAIADINSTYGGDEIIALTKNSNELYTFNNTGNKIWNTTIGNYVGMGNCLGLAAGDITGDGSTEIIAQCGNETIALDNEGNSLWDYDEGIYNSYDYVYPVLSNIDTTSSGLEVIIVSGNLESAYILTLDGNGKVLSRIGIPCDYECVGGLAIQDIDNDGYLDAAYVMDDKLVFYTTDSTDLNSAWPMYGHDLNNTHYNPG